MSESADDRYVAGACNIGGADIAARRRFGLFGVAATLVIAGIVLAVGLPPVAMLVTTPTAYLAAIGLLQARNRFCVGFAAAHRYGFDDTAGPSGTVTDEADVAADRTRAREINGSAARWTIAVTTALIVVAYLLD